MAPLWEVLAKLVTPEPNTRTHSHIWYWKDTKNRVLDSGSIITAEQAERRVLILENPNMRGESKITDTLYAGLQLILPGEVAPSHRHTQSALRFVMHGNGAYTAVDGEKTIMRPGDFIITPSWTWHDHGNESNEPMIWLDGLDIPMVNHFSASFSEKLNEDTQELKRPEGDSLARYGAGLLPVDHKLFDNLASPVFSYPYDRTKEALDKMKESKEWDKCHGLRLKYVNPSNGGHAIPTMATFMQLIPKSFSGNSYRSTDGTIYTVVEGQGKTTINDQEYLWNKGDIFVVPPWAKIKHETIDESVLFSFSDRPVQELLGLFREKIYKQ
ncbi:MAG: gentisate 1,2-dioxygenase [Alphaproteobacteria bacterium]|nr:MAG: gentisate 1,2-dioxygenase [Alphaproteobacteria bacterium]